MGYIVGLILACMGVVLHKQRKTWCAPDVLFCYEYATITILASLKLFGMYGVSMKAWGIIMIGSISFIIGVSYAYRHKFILRKERTMETGEHGDKTKPMISNRAFWIIMCCLYIYASKDLMQSISMLKTGVNLDDIRQISVGVVESDTYIRKGGLIWELIDSFVFATETILIAITIEMFVVDIKRYGKYMFAAVGLVLIHSFSDGGRFGIAYLAIEVLACNALCRRYSSYTGIIIASKTKKYIRYIICFLISIIVLITLMRGTETKELFTKYYRYICGNVVFFDTLIMEIDAKAFYSFSFAGLYGLWATVLPIFHNAFGLAYPETYLNAIKNVMTTQTFRKIGEGMYTNAFATPFYHLYADFRLVGVVFGMLLFGYICGRAYMRTRAFQTKQVAFYLIIVQMIFKSLQIFPFASKNYFMVFVAICVFNLLSNAKVKQ